MPFVIDANLDAEAKWSGLALNAPVLQRISLYGTLLTALAPQGEPIELWTPVAVDRKRVRVPGMLTLRAGSPPQPNLRWADPSARAANDRRLARSISALPQSFVLEELHDNLTWPSTWVAKAVWSAAGRDRCRGEGPPNTEQRTRLSRLVAACKALVVEPWCDRILDVGVCATVDAAGAVTAEAPHGLIVDARGNFAGIDLASPPLEPAEATQLTHAVSRAGTLLATTNYVGPFAVDAFVHRTPEGRALHVCEINARYTFGWVARALARRTGATRLGFGAPPPGDRTTTLIEDRDDNIRAWIA